MEAIRRRIQIRAFVDEDAPDLFPEFSTHEKDADDERQIHGGENVDARIAARHERRGVSVDIGRKPAQQNDDEARVVARLRCGLIDHSAAQRGHDPVGEIAERVLAQQRDREDAEHFRAAREQHARQQRRLRGGKPEHGHDEGAQRHDDRQNHRRDAGVETPVLLEHRRRRCVH